SDKDDGSQHNRSLVDAIGYAALLGNAAILDRLLALPHDDAALNRYKQQELTQLATYGRTDALELLRQRGWEMDDAMRLQAVNSMRPDAISYVLKTSGGAIEDFCITPSRYDGGSPLSNAIQYYPEKRWQQLISLGIARLQGCARAKDDDERDDPANGNPMNQIAIALLLDPFSMSDQHKRYVPERIKQLREAGMNAADFSTPTMRGFAAAGFSSEPALQPLLSALGVSAPQRPASKGNPSHPSTLVGVYYGGMGEVGTGLTLRADGRFQWFMSYGAIDKQATGSWEVIDRQVIFTPDVQPPHTWFKIADTSQYADGAATGQPLTIKIAGVSNHLTPFFEGRIYDDTGKFGRLHMNDQFETEVKLEGQPRTIALWFEQMETRVAAEVAVPDIPRLKSITITVTPPSKPPSAPFNEVAEISDGGLLIGGTLYRK
ncbi:MAG: hypothetical protein LBG66_05815, partial [Gallionellaceae bacterium]|nr:hypothetical protein [Gallionellaceae bacterium]